VTKSGIQSEEINMKLMKPFSMFAQTCAVAAVLSAALATSASAGSSTFYHKYFSTGGAIYPYYVNDNNWGYSNTSGSGFMEMVLGTDWGTWSPYHPLPLQVWQVKSGSAEYFSENVLKMDDTKMNKSFPCPVCYEFKYSAYRVGGRRIIIEDLL
jgi:hypothetical protein